MSTVKSNVHVSAVLYTITGYIPMGPGGDVGRGGFPMMAYNYGEALSERGTFVKLLV